MLRSRPVPRLRRYTAFVLFWSFAGFACARTEPAEIPPPRSWELTAQLKTAAGHKDNLLLSSVRREASAFAQAEAEVFWWRLPDGRFEAIAFANSTRTRFLGSASHPDESQSFAHAEARWFPGPSLDASASLEGYHLDQVFDLSASDAERVTARLNVLGATAIASLRWRVKPRTWVELRPGLQRDRYRDRSDDNWQRTARLSSGCSLFGDRAEATLSLQAQRRDYDTRQRYTVAGRPLAGTGLAFLQRECELGFSFRFGSAKNWKSSTTATLSDNDDNGSGYFDYARGALRHELSWSGRLWKMRAVARAGRYEYRVQTVGIGINPPHRRKDELLWQLRCERTLTSRVVLFAEGDWERSRSNDPLADYGCRTLASGLGWSF